MHKATLVLLVLFTAGCGGGVRASAWKSGADELTITLTRHPEFGILMHRPLTQTIVIQTLDGVVLATDAVIHKDVPQRLEHGGSVLLNRTDNLISISLLYRHVGYDRWLDSEFNGTYSVKKW